MQIFISSTYTDMLEERQATVQAVLNADHIPAGMELFKAGNESQLQTIYRWIDECDLYLLILGGRYGSIETVSMKSYIELEYEYALNHNIPVFAVILSDSYLHSKAAKCNYEVFETNNVKKYKKFKQKVKTKTVNEVNTIDEMKLAITNSLHEFEKSKKIKGWIKYSDNVITTQFETLPKNKKEELRKNLAYSLIGMNTSSIDFYNSVDKRVFDLACNSPYIDKFKRIIEIQICEDNENAVINMENYFKFVNLNGCKNFYRSSPVFPRLREAQSYKHLKFEINNVDYLSKINSNIQVSEKNNQFKYVVKNEYPINEIDTFDGCTIFHKIQYKVYLQNFYQYHALIFPCRDYTLEIVLKNHQNKYYLALATNEFFDVNNYVERTQYRDKHICNINYLDWLLPGSGYSFTIQKIYEEVQDQNLKNEEFNKSIFDNHKSDEYRLSYSSVPSVAILTTDEAYVKLSRRNGNVTDFDAKLAMCVLDRLHQLLPKGNDKELLLLRGVWNNDQSSEFLIYVDYIYDISIKKPRFSQEELEELLEDDYEGVLSTADVKCICEDFNSDYFFPNSKKYYERIL